MKLDNEFTTHAQFWISPEADTAKNADRVIIGGELHEITVVENNGERAMIISHCEDANVPA